MKIVIFGGSGFIGNNLCNILEKQYGEKCFPVCSKDYDLIENNIINNELRKTLKGSFVVYAAGIPRLVSDDLDIMYNNITMVENFIGLLNKFEPKKVIYLSSVEVYGMPKELPISEKTSLWPETHYGMGKIIGEKLLSRWHRLNKIPLCILRLPGVYGYGDKGLGLIGKMIKCIKEKKQFELFNEGLEKRDYLYVADIAKAIYLLKFSDFYFSIINLISSKSYSVKSIIYEIQKKYGKCKIKQTCDKKFKPQHLVFDNGELNKILPGIQMTDLTDGINCYNKIFE